MRILPLIRLLAPIAAMSACAAPVPPEPDILDLAAKNPGRFGQGKATDGTRFRDPDLERAANDLRHIPRPWTVSRMLRQYRHAESVEEKALLLRVMAASRDPRAAVLLGETLPDQELELRVAATVGLYFYFFDSAHGINNLEGMMSDADEWWQAHERQLRAEAGRLARQWPER